jgi:phage terminase large subunit
MKVSESELAVTFPHNGARIRLYGAENYERLRGLYLDGVVIDEAGDIDPRAWPEVIRPALSDRAGWATFIGTPKGRNAFYKIIHGDTALGTAGALRDPDWYGAVLKSSETQIVPEAELADARKTLTPEQYLQEYQCSFDAAVRGAYYGKEMALAEEEKRLCRVPHEKSADTFAAWDLGIGDSTAIWVFQIIGREWHFIRHHEANGVGLDHYVDWIKSLPFAVHEHILPHDADARELQTGKSRVEFLEERGFRCRVLPRADVDTGIDAARVRFNRFWFDSEHCAHGIDCLRMYRADFDEKNQVLRTRPLHDWASHTADAFRYAVMGGEEQKKIDLKQYDVDTSWVV